ncbi:MAG: hypothetical protein ACK5NN_14380 [Sphingomonadaceae bacterium]
MEWGLHIYCLVIRPGHGFLTGAFAILVAMSGIGLAHPASAQQLTEQLEVMDVSVGSGWTTVNTLNTYTDPVVVCTYNLPSRTSPNAVPRIQSTGANSFQVRIQQFSPGYSFTSGRVFCVVSEEGAHTTAGGLKYEARRVTSSGTSGNTWPNNWNAPNTEEVTSAVSQSYSSPVVLGQVMSFNDSRPSAFWTNNCAQRNGLPFNNGRVCVGKHVGQINQTRSAETLGYIVAESGGGSANDMAFLVGRGSNSVRGVSNSAPHIYTVSGDFDLGIVTQNSENGGQGGWAVLFGADPLPANRINLAIDEETVAGDTSRSHANEQVAYWVFRDNQDASVGVSKTSHIPADSSSSFALPEADMIYTITVENTGSKPVDTDSLFIVDRIPVPASPSGASPLVSLFTGDMAGAGSGPVHFVDSDSGLTFSSASDVGYSKSTTAPTSFAACTDSLTGTYDPDVRFICIRPAGAMNTGSFSASSFEIRYRVQIK